MFFSNFKFISLVLLILLDCQLNNCFPIIFVACLHPVRCLLTEMASPNQSSIIVFDICIREEKIRTSVKIIEILCWKYFSLLTSNLISSNKEDVKSFPIRATYRVYSLISKMWLYLHLVILAEYKKWCNWRRHSVYLDRNGYIYILCEPYCKPWQLRMP